MDYILYHSRVSIIMTYGVVISDERICLIVTKFIHVYYIIMQNGRILLLIVLDKNIYILLGQSLPIYYALDSTAILYRYYANIIQWL